MLPPATNSTSVLSGEDQTTAVCSSTQTQFKLDKMLQQQMWQHLNFSGHFHKQERKKELLKVLKIVLKFLNSTLQLINHFYVKLLIKD